MEERRKAIDQAPELLTTAGTGVDNYPSVHVKLKTIDANFKAPTATKTGGAHMIEVRMHCHCCLWVAGNQPQGKVQTQNAKTLCR